jgi:VanZ family protein
VPRECFDDDHELKALKLMKRFGLFVLVLWICFVIFGSWYPFAFQYHDLHEAWYYWLHSGESDKSKTDMFVNFVVGIPTGVLTFVWLVGNWDYYSVRQCRCSFQIAIASFAWLVICVLTPSVVELGQYYFDRRFPSIIDSTLQFFGSIVGLILCWLNRRQLRDFLCFGDRVWANTSNGLKFCLALSICFLISQLWPGIPSISPSEIKEKIRSVLSFQTDLEPLDVIIGSMVSFGLAIPFGYLISIKMSALGFSKPWIRVALVAIITLFMEFCKLFIEARLPTPQNCFAVFLGSMAGLLLSLRFRC